MNCQEARDWLDAFVDGELELSQSIEIEKHLKECSQCAAERDASGEIARMPPKTGAARVDRFFELAVPAEFLGELRKRNRRRVILNPAPKVFQP